jgi:hypothetical protein
MVDLFRLSVGENGAISVTANAWVALVLIVVGVGAIFAFAWVRDAVFRQKFEIDEVEIGVGQNKVKIRPNHEDLQIAYRLWVELKTRKLGLLFEEDHDVIADVYSSWYDFFRITRELIKSVPVTKIRGEESTQILVGISIDVLNKAIRPHLTKWQARYRHWLEVEMKKDGSNAIPPQELQKRFPEYKQLVSELRHTNAQLVAYAKILAHLVELGPKATRDTKKAR